VLQILEVIRTGIEKGERAGYQAEREGFGELGMTPQSKQLIGLFNAQTECKKNPFKAAEKPVK